MSKMKICKHCGTQYAEKTCPRCGCSNVALITTLKVNYTKNTLVVVYVNGVQKRKTYGSTKILLKLKEPSNVHIRLYSDGVDFRNNNPFATCGGTIYPGRKYIAQLTSSWIHGNSVELICTG